MPQLMARRAWNGFFEFALKDLLTLWSKKGNFFALFASFGGTFLFS